MDSYLRVIQGEQKDLRVFHSSHSCHHGEIHREGGIWGKESMNSHQHTHRWILFTAFCTSHRVLTKRTGEELPGGRAQLNLLVNLEGQIGQLLSLSAGAQPCLQGHALHVLRQLQHLQHIDEFTCRGNRRRWAASKQRRLTASPETGTETKVL